MKLTNARNRMIQGRNMAIDQQPLRCAGCNEPVSHVNPSHCACTRPLVPSKEKRCGACGSASFRYPKIAQGVRGYQCLQCGAVKPEREG